MNEIATSARTAIPLSAPAPLKVLYEALYVHSYTLRSSTTSMSGKQNVKDSEQKRTFSLGLDHMLCNQQDVLSLRAFLKDFVGRKPVVEALTVEVAKPELTSHTLNLMGVSESGRHPVYFPSTETVTFYVAVPEDYRDAVLEVLKVLSAKISSDPSPVVRNLMASAYLSIWKKQPGNRMRTAPGFMDMVGLADFQTWSLISYVPSVLEPFKDLQDLPLHGSIVTV